jgi:hypothetical protein
MFRTRTLSLRHQASPSYVYECVILLLKKHEFWLCLRETSFPFLQKCWRPCLIVMFSILLITSSRWPKIPSDLPKTEGWLPKWHLIVAVMAIFNTIQNFATLTLTRRIYSGVPPATGMMIISVFLFFVTDYIQWRLSKPEPSQFGLSLPPSCVATLHIISTKKCMQSSHPQWLFVHVFRDPHVHAAKLTWTQFFQNLWYGTIHLSHCLWALFLWNSDFPYC